MSEKKSELLTYRLTETELNFLKQQAEVMEKSVSVVARDYMLLGIRAQKESLSRIDGLERNDSDAR